jgi:hypothetical protein
MKKPSLARDPSTIVNRTVTPRRPPNADLREREYLTPKEVDRLQDAARKHSRYGHRDATAILIAYRHGLRASELCELPRERIVPQLLAHQGGEAVGASAEVHRLGGHQHPHAQHIPQPAEINPSLRANRSPRNLDHDRPRPVRSRIRRADLADRRHHRRKHGSFLGRQGQLTSSRSLAPGKQMLRRDVVPTRDFRYNRSGRVGFRNDPTLVLRPPPAPAPNPNADIDTTAAL